MAKYIELIEKFENEELSVKENESFLKELQSNSELRKEFELRNKISKAIKDDNLNELKKTLDKAQQKFDSKN
ncbi:MAG: hypothetical protein K8R41_12305 [Bacteroidales bacterium]|nr:hypothetical protein [Bacteroidales bacterium]